MSEKTWTKEEQAEHRAQWVAALRSGDYKQGKGRLRDDHGKFCCLGVATDLAAKAGVEGAHKSLAFDIGLITEVREWLGLLSPGGSLRTPQKNALSGTLPDALWLMNDFEGASFSQLADVIERGDVLLEGEE